MEVSFVCKQEGTIIQKEEDELLFKKSPCPNRVLGHE